MLTVVIRNDLNYLTVLINKMRELLSCAKNDVTYTSHTDTFNLESTSVRSNT